MHRLLETQLVTATRGGQVDMTRLLAQVASTYERMDTERRGIVARFNVVGWPRARGKERTG